ncbi:MAG: RagB/SusD family nutrient uptake outer membrane protein [Prolixibacteraceae bacterium]|jgi:hypothetical protein|nr:RagB/SusD family nutrient uptake outer membrane protein [Prolixibacteraceae bacterium]
MKKIFLIIGILGLLFTACEDFLTEENKSDINAETFYATEDGFNALVNATYSELRTIYGGAPWLFCAGTDMYVEGRQSQPVGLSEYRFLTPSEVEAGVLYDVCYNAIQTCNMALHYAELTEDNANLDARIGEIKAIRAWSYFLLVQTYGGVSLVTDFISSPVLSFERNSAEEIYAYLVPEMTEALGMVNDAAFDGHITKRAVQHFLAKIHLTRGYESFASNDDFSKAASYADAAIAGQSLNLSFEELWTPGNEQNEEVLFSVQYDAVSIATDPENLGQSQSSYFGPYMGGSDVAGMAPWRSYNLCPTMYFFDLFTENDSRLEATMMLNIYDNYYDYYNVADLSATLVDYYYAPKWASSDADIKAWRDADPSNRNETIVYKYETWEASKNSATDYMHPAIKKFDDPTSAFSTTGMVSTRDLIIARLGETYLIAAEAYLKSGDNGKALDRLNEVRRRAAKEGTDISVSSININTILDERALELAGEYHRWFDLKRTGTLIERCDMYNKDVEASFFNGDGGKKILRPIPQSAIDLNQNKDFAQNPGY